MSWSDNSRGEWYVALQLVVMGLVTAGPWLDQTAWRGDPEPWRVAGSILGVLGSGLALAGLLALGRNLTPLPHPKDGANLVATGPYAIVRHPIYAGIALAALGWALAWRSPLTLALAVALLAFFDVKSRREERWLLVAYPGYAEYRRRVARLIPFLH